ncbi:MAG: hypothetical protein QXS05_08880, partial [Candidatus Bathyarchaeia archaeon]
MELFDEELIYGRRPTAICLKGTRRGDRQVYRRQYIRSARRLLEETGPPEKSRFLRALKIQTETLAIARSMGEERCSVLRMSEYEGLSTIFGV